MVALKSYVQQIIYIGIIAIIIEIIMPKGNTKKYIYAVLSLFVLLNVVSPIVNVVKNIDVQNTLDNVLETISGNVSTDTSNIEEFSEYANAKVKEKLEEKLKTELATKLLEIDIKVKEVKIITDIDSNFKEIEILVGNLEYLEENKITKIADTIKLVAESYGVDENNIVISEEGK